MVQHRWWQIESKRNSVDVHPLITIDTSNATTIPNPITTTTTTNATTTTTNNNHGETTETTPMQGKKRQGSTRSSESETQPSKAKQDHHSHHGHHKTSTEVRRWCGFLVFCILFVVVLFLMVH